MRKIISLGLLAAGAAWYFGREKVSDYKAIFQELEVDFLGLKNLQFKNKNLRFLCDILIKNNSNLPLNLKTGSAVVLRRLMFYTKGGEFVGEASVNITGIEIPARGSLQVKDIPATVPITKIENLLGTAWELFSNPDSMRINAEIEVLGKKTIIEA